MNYLGRKTGSGRMHLWTGLDTVCKMYSTGGLRASKYKPFLQKDHRPICQNCVRESMKIVKKNDNPTTFDERKAHALSKYHERKAAEDLDRQLIVDMPKESKDVTT